MDALKALSSILKPTELVTDTDQCSPYITDYSFEAGQSPMAIIKPTSNLIIPKILSIASAHKIPIYPWGAGTGKAGNATHTKPGFVLSFENMAHLLAVDKTNKTITVEPGATTIAVQNAAKAEGLYFPPDPASLETCTIGGNVAVNAGGPRAVKYGVTGNYVQQIKGYTMNGQPFCFGGKTKKDVAGYNLKQLFIGSEGTLGVITEITLKLIPYPTHRHLIVLEFEKLDTAILCLQRLSQHGLTPSMMEFIDKPCIEYGKQTAWTFETLEAVTGYVVMLEFDGSSNTEVNAQLHRAEEIIKPLNPTQTRTNLDDNEEKKWWDFRRNISYILSAHSQDKISHDVTVPISNLPAMMAKINSLSSIKTKALGYGHLGDGNIHANILNIGLNETKWESEKQTATDTLMKACLDLGGTITGEHGIGVSKKKYMTWQFTEHELNLMKAIKQTFDPHHLLNPDKIF